MFNPSQETVAIIIFGIVILILILCAIIVTIVYRYQRRQLVYFKFIEELKTRHKNEVLESQLEVQTQTFKSISKEVHANIGQKLTLAKIHLTDASYSDLESLKKTVSETVDMISDGMEDLRDISRSMSSDIINYGGLLEGIDFEVEQLNKLKIYTVRVDITGERYYLPVYTELVIYRIIQEALHNIVKHAKATEVVICLIYEDILLVIEIKDNGIGFSVSPDTHLKNGLENIRKRTTLLNGKYQFGNEIGVKIRIEIPVEEGPSKYQNNRENDDEYDELFGELETDISPDENAS